MRAATEEADVVPVAVVVAVAPDDVLLDLDVAAKDTAVIVLLCGHVPGARSILLFGVGVFVTLVFGAVPTVMVALPAPR